MAKQIVSYSELLARLNQSKSRGSDPALYETIAQLLRSLDNNQSITTNDITVNKNALDGPILTYEADNELANSRALIAGTGIGLDKSIGQELIISATGGGVSTIPPIPFFVNDDSDESFPIPGARGNDGATGSPGSQGLSGISVFPIDGEDGQDSYIPGPAGANGTNGSGSDIPIVVTSNKTIATQTCWVVSESLEISAGVILEIAGGARLEITGAAISYNSIPISNWLAVNGALYNTFMAPQFISVQIPDNASVNWRFITQPIISIPYDIIITINGDAFPAVLNTANTYGLYITDGTKLIGLELLQQTAGSGGANRLRIERMNSVTSDNSTIAGPTINITTTLVTLRIRNDGNTRYYYYYVNGFFILFFSEPVNSFLVETKIGIGGLCVVGSSAATMSVILLGWQLGYH